MRIFKILQKLIISFFLLLIIFWIIFQTPIVQNAIKQKITASLSRSLQTQVQIGKMNLRLFDKSEFTDFIVMDQVKDTLFAANKIQIDFRILPLLKKKIYFNRIYLEKSNLKIYGIRNTNHLNSNFVFENLKQSNPSDSRNPAWKVTGNKIDLNSFNFSLNGENNLKIKSFISKLSLSLNHIDIDEKKIHIKNFNLQDSEVSIQNKHHTIRDPILASDTKFPFFGWAIVADKISTRRNKYAIKRIEEFGLINNQITVSNINFHANAFEWGEDIIRGNIQELGLNTDKNIKIESLSGEFQFTPKLAQLKNFSLETLSSKVFTNTLIQFENINDLTEFIEKVDVESDFKNTSVSHIELHILSNLIGFKLPIIPTSDIKLEGMIQKKGRKAVVNGVSIELAKQLELNMQGGLSLTMNHALQFHDFEIIKLNSSYQKLIKLFPNLILNEELNVIGDFSVKGIFNGNQTKLIADQLTFDSKNISFSNTRIVGRHIFKDHKEAGIEIHTEKIKIHPNLTQSLLPDSLSYIAKELDIIEYEGNISRESNFINLIGKIKTNAGNVEMESKIRFLKDYNSKEFLASVSYDSEIRKMVLKPGIVRIFLEDSLKYVVDSLGIVEFSGNLSGNFKLFQLTGDITSKHGLIGLDASMRFQELDKSKNYTAGLSFSKFNFKPFSKGIIEETDAQLWLEGNISPINDLNIYWQTNIKNIIIKKYQYKSIEFEGSFVNNQLKACGVLNDKNLDGVFDLEARLKDNFMDVGLSLDMDSFNLYRTYLYPHALSMKGNILADIKGTTYNDLYGQIFWDNWNLSNDTLYISGDKLQIISEQSAEQEKKLILNSKHLNIELDGKFKISMLPDIFSDHLNNYFQLPNVNPMKLRFRDSTLQDEYDFVVQIKGTDLSEIPKLLFPGSIGLDDIDVSGEFNSHNTRFALNGSAKNLTYKDMVLDSLTFILSGDGNNLSNQIVLNHILMGQLDIPKMVVITDYGNQKLNFSTDISGNNPKEKIIFNGSVVRQNEEYLIRFEKDLRINENIWSISAENLMRIKDSGFEIENFILSNNNQNIKVSTELDESNFKRSSINIITENFKLEEFTKWFGDAGLYPSGKLSGRLQLYDLNSKPYFIGNIMAEDLKIHDQKLGQAKLIVESSSNKNLLKFNGHLIEQSNHVLLSGEYLIDVGEIGAIIDINHLDLKPIELFSNGEIEQVEGSLKGYLEVKGPIWQPLLKGNLEAFQIKANLVRTKSTFTIPFCSFALSENQIKVDTFQIHDENDRKSSITGSISHQYFNNFNLDMHYESEEFQVLNSNKSDHELFYGKLITRAFANIKGPLDRMKININATTAPGTDLTLLNSSYLNTNQHDNFIIFSHPDNWIEQELTQQKLIVPNPYNFELSSNLEITPEAKFRIIVDAGSGDEIQCQGYANIVALMDIEGNLILDGNYSFTKGKYKFNYEGLVKKEFEIENGSSLIFPGASKDYRFNITTSYKTKVSPLILIQKQSSLTDEERKEASKPVEIIVLLNIKGSLSDPELSFQISSLNVGDGRIGNALNRRLAKLNESPDEINKQVLGLLLFNSFLDEGQVAASESLTRTVEASAFASLNGMITNQLNKLANQYIKGFEVSFDMEAYNAGTLDNSGGLLTEMGVTVSKRLLNDRLKVKVGSNVNLSRENIAFWSNTAFSSVAGDFVIEYKLNEKGNYLVRVFHLNDFNIIEDESNYKTGVGFVIRKRLQEKAKK